MKQDKDITIIKGRNMNKLDIKKELLPKGVKILDNGQMEVTITFDVSNNGHNFGASRNYDLVKYKTMIDDINVQKAIKDGYCKGYLGHQKRNTKAGYLPSEVDTDGNEVEPVCMTKSMSMNENMVTHTQRIFNTEQGIKVQKLILNGGVGFSSVHNLKEKKFFGFDAVISPNFSTNRVIVDSICNGACEIDSVIDNAINDTVGVNADDEIKEIAKDLLMKDDTVVDMIKIKDFIQALKEDKSNIEINLSQIKEELKKANDENAILKTSLDTEIKKNKTINDNYQDFIKNDYQNIITQLDELGIKLNNGKLEIQKDSLSSLFKPKNFEEFKKVDFDSIKMLHKKNFAVENRPRFTF